MKGDPKVIEFLNKALTNELTAINQYWLHYRVLDDWGVTKLAEYERKESIEEMEHADKLAARILFLNAMPWNVARACATLSAATCSTTFSTTRKSMSTSSKPSST